MRTELVQVRVTKEEKAAFERSAKANAMTLGAWARTTLWRESRYEERPPTGEEIRAGVRK